MTGAGSPSTRSTGRRTPRRHDGGAADPPAPRLPAAPGDGVPAGPRRTDAGRQRAAEPGHLRHHLGWSRRPGC
ncbi:hypothetical protein LV779_31690 [Streptomyces thinghirensis]|nr:hypothetical protein [Streptomyces thinghirensis]